MLFEQDYIKRQTRFVSRKPAKVIISSIEAVAESMRLKVHSRNYKVSVCNPTLHNNFWTMLWPKVLKLIEMDVFDLRGTFHITQQTNFVVKSYCHQLSMPSVLFVNAAVQL